MNIKTAVEMSTGKYETKRNRAEKMWLLLPHFVEKCGLVSHHFTTVIAIGVLVLLTETVFF
jgi:hypothetical protein